MLVLQCVLQCVLHHTGMPSTGTRPQLLKRITEMSDTVTAAHKTHDVPAADASGVGASLPAVDGSGESASLPAPPPRAQMHATLAANATKMQEVVG